MFALGRSTSRAFSFPVPSITFTEWLYITYGYEPWDQPTDDALIYLLREYNKIHFFEPIPPKSTLLDAF
jgi:hypothetical protein